MDTKTIVIAGAALGVGYLLFGKKAKAAAASPVAPKNTTGAFSIRLDPSGGRSCVDAKGKLVALAFCTDPSSQLEGYFSTGAACCPNCASGRACKG